MIAIFTGVRGYFIVVLICTFLLISDVHHLFICLLAICMSSSERKSLFRSSDSVCFDSELYELYIFWILTHYWTSHFQISFPIHYLFNLLVVSFTAYKLFSFMRFYFFFIFAFVILARGDRSQINYIYNIYIIYTIYLYYI